MPDSIKLDFKLVASPESKTAAQVAVTLDQLRIALLSCHQKTVTGAVRGSTFMPFEINWHQAMYRGHEPRYCCTVYMITNGRHQKLMHSGDEFSKEQKDNREYFCSWLQEQSVRLRDQSENAMKNIYWFNLGRQLETALVSRDEELTPVEFEGRKQQLATYLEALSQAVRRLTPEPGKYQAIPDTHHPEEWSAYLFKDPRAVGHV